MLCSPTCTAQFVAWPFCWPLPIHLPCVALQEMEAAAVAWSADLFGCPVFCIKSVTDIVDGERPAQVRSACSEEASCLREPPAAAACNNRLPLPLATTACRGCVLSSRGGGGLGRSNWRFLHAQPAYWSLLRTPHTPLHRRSSSNPGRSH